MPMYDFACDTYGVLYEYMQGIHDDHPSCFICKCLSVEDHKPRRIISLHSFSPGELLPYKVVAVFMVKAMLERGGNIRSNVGIVAGYTETDKHWFGCYRNTTPGPHNLMRTVWEGKDAKIAATHYVEMSGVMSTYRNVQEWFKDKGKMI